MADGRLGIALYHGIESSAQLAGYGRLAERAGFDSLWVTERYFHEETFGMLGFLASCTKRIKLGLAVANPYTRNPALLAMSTATLDRLSNGRFILGIGRSERSTIEGLMGIPYREPLAMLEECVGVVRRLLEGGSVSGGDYGLRDVSLRFKPHNPKLPIYIAAMGPRALRLAARIGDGVILNAYSPVKYVRYAIHELTSAAGESANKLDVACMVVVRLGEDSSQIMDDGRKRIVSLLREKWVGELLLGKGGFDLGLLKELRSGGSDDPRRLINDGMVKQFYAIGHEDEVAKRVDEYRRAGVKLPILVPRLEQFEVVSKVFSRG